MFALLGIPRICSPTRAALTSGRYAALAESVDESVGRLRTKLAELELAARTIIIFTPDNGGLTMKQVTSNLDLRSAKAYEGGVRVPAIARVPGVTQAGTAGDTPVITM